MGESVVLTAGILRNVTVPGIRIGAIYSSGHQSARRRGGHDDIVEITKTGLRLRSREGSRDPFEVTIPVMSIRRIRKEAGFLKQRLWIDAQESHGLEFRNRDGVQQALAALADLCGIQAQ